MINLLPPEEKQKLLLRNKEKLATIFGIVVLVSFVCLTLILLSIKFYILADTDYKKNILAQTEKITQTADFKNLNGIVQRYNGILAQLDSFYRGEIYFSKALKTITDVSTPDGLHLTNFSLSRNSGGIVQVNVSGVSDTRDNLLIFKKNIEGATNGSLVIKNPIFSSGSWINPKNVNFSLTLEIRQNENQQ